MKKILTLILGLCLAAGAAEAKPHPKLKKIVTALYIIGLPTAMATWNTIEVSRCRQRAGIERCESRYGAWQATQVVNHVVSDAILPLVAYKLKQLEEENGDRPSWHIITLGTAGFNAYMAVNQRGQPGKRVCPSGYDWNGFRCEDRD